MSAWFRPRALPWTSRCMGAGMTESMHSEALSEQQRPVAAAEPSQRLAPQRSTATKRRKLHRKYQ